MMMFSTALQLWSVRDDMKTDFEGTLEKIKKIGYHGIELVDLYDYSARDVKKMCDKIGLNPISAHIPFSKMIANPEMLDDYVELGCEYIVSAGLGIEYRPASGRFSETVEGIKILSEKAKSLGMKFAYHNHDYEFEKINGEYALDIIYKEISPELLDAQLDTCWVNVGGENPAEYVRRYAGRVNTLHLKDFIGYRTENTYAYAIASEDEKKTIQNTIELRTLGSGCQDFPEILKAAKSAGTKWIIVEQDNPSEGLTSIECALKSLNYLKTL